MRLTTVGPCTPYPQHIIFYNLMIPWKFVLNQTAFERGFSLQQTVDWLTLTHAIHICMFIAVLQYKPGSDMCAHLMCATTKVSLNCKILYVEGMRCTGLPLVRELLSTNQPKLTHQTAYQYAKGRLIYQLISIFWPRNYMKIFKWFPSNTIIREPEVCSHRIVCTSTSIKLAIIRYYSFSSWVHSECK